MFHLFLVFSFVIHLLVCIQTIIHVFQGRGGEDTTRQEGELLIYLLTIYSSQESYSPRDLHVNGNQECFPRSNSTHKILELSAMIIGGLHW